MGSVTSTAVTTSEIRPHAQADKKTFDTETDLAESVLDSETQKDIISVPESLKLLAGVSTRKKQSGIKDDPIAVHFLMLLLSIVLIAIAISLVICLLNHIDGDSQKKKSSRKKRENDNASEVWSDDEESTVTGNTHLDSPPPNWLPYAGN